MAIQVQLPANPNFDRVLFLLVGLIIGLLFMRQCKKQTNDPTPGGSHTVVTTVDTVKPKPQFIEVKVSVPGPIRKIKVPYYVHNDSLCPCKYTLTYADSLVDSNLVIAYRDSVNGLLLGKKISYKLKVPLKINTTTTITDSIPFPVAKCNAKLMGGIEAGGDMDYPSVSLMAQFISKKKYAIGYRYDILQHTHHGSFSYQLFKVGK